MEGINIRLSILMFLEFFIWGAWYVTMGTYLSKIGFDGLDIGNAYSTVNWGAIISPLLIGMIADRYFEAQKVLGVLHLLGAVFLYLVSLQTDPMAFFWNLLIYALLYMPTIGLANSIGFFHLPNPEKSFASIRVWGTLGWIVVGLIVGWSKLEDSVNVFYWAMGASVILAIYSFTMPPTPPKDKGKSASVMDLLGLSSLTLLKDRSFAIFILCSLLISIPLAFYYSFTNLFLNETGMINAASKMTFGQVSEVVFMLLIPFFFQRLGVKKMLVLGMGAWVLRYLLFANGSGTDGMWMLILGIVLHGICYDFFFVTGQIYVDKAAPINLRASAQGLITLTTYGVGMLIGSWSSGWVVKHYTSETNVHDWPAIWYVPAAMAAVSLGLFMLLFKEKKEKEAIMLNG